MKTSNIRRLSAQIKALEQRIDELRASAERCTGTIDDMPHGTHRSDRVSEAAVKLVTLQCEYADRKIQLERLRDELIDNLTPTEAEIIELRDLEGLRWLQVAFKVGKEESYCRKIYRRAIKKLDTLK